MMEYIRPDEFPDNAAKRINQDSVQQRMYSNMLISAMLQNNIDISDYEDSSKPVVKMAFQQI